MKQKKVTCTSYDQQPSTNHLPYLNTFPSPPLSIQFKPNQTVNTLKLKPLISSYWSLTLFYFQTTQKKTQTSKQIESNNGENT
jgi:hypothetical protein